MIRTSPQANKTTNLPAGVSMTWRTRQGRKPYLEYQVRWVDDLGKVRIKHFYAGVDPTPKDKREAKLAAIQFRRAYEKTVLRAIGGPRRPKAPALLAPAPASDPASNQADSYDHPGFTLFD